MSTIKLPNKLFKFLVFNVFLYPFLVLLSIHLILAKGGSSDFESSEVSIEVSRREYARHSINDFFSRI